MRSPVVSCRIPPRWGPAPPDSRSWLERLAGGWVRAGFSGPQRLTPEGRTGPPDPAGVDPDSINLVRATHLEDLRDAAEWAASARFLSTERRAAMTLLTDTLAIGATEPPTAFLPGGEAESILDPFQGRSVPSVTLWRPVAGRSSAESGPRSSGIASSEIPRNCMPGRSASRRRWRPPKRATAPWGTPRCNRGRLRHRKLASGRGRNGDGGGRYPRAGRARPGGHRSRGRSSRGDRRAEPCAEHAARQRAHPLHPYRAFSEGTSAKLLFGAFGQLLGAATALSIKNPIGLLPAPSLARRSRQPGQPSFDPRTATRAIHTIALKKFPGSRAVQSVLAAIEKLPRIDPEAVESITVETYPFSATVSGWSRPDTGPIAMQSHIPTAVALWLEARHRRVPFSADHYPQFRAPATITLAERVTVQAHEFGQAAHLRAAVSAGRR